MSAVLHYFDGRGKAEIIRLTMAASNIKVNKSNNTPLSIIDILFMFFLVDSSHLPRKRAISQAYFRFV